MKEKKIQFVGWVVKKIRNKFCGFRIIPDKAIKFFDSILRDVIVYRQENNIQRNDLVQYLIDVKRKSIEVEKGNIQSDVITQGKKSSPKSQNINEIIIE